MIITIRNFLEKVIVQKYIETSEYESFIAIITVLKRFFQYEGHDRLSIS
jgi:hypothetical protein